MLQMLNVFKEIVEQALISYFAEAEKAQSRVFKKDNLLYLDPSGKSIISIDKLLPREVELNKVLGRDVPNERIN